MKSSKLIKQILGDKRYLNREAFTFCDGISIKLKTALKDKKLLKDKPEILDSLRDDYLEYLEDTSIPLVPSRKSKTNFIGIELECFAAYDAFDLREQIIEHNLSKIVQVAEDGSIEEDFGNSHELRILLPEKQLTSGLKKVKKLLTKGKFGVNDSCGLHIHIDMRNRDVKKCYKNLLKFQDVLFAMVNKDRWNNEFCCYTTKLNEQNRYLAINKTRSYARHQTIEVRLHHATLDMKLIEKWVKLLLQIVGAPKLPNVKTKSDILKWIGKKKDLKSYVSKNFNNQGFNHHTRIFGDDDYYNWDY